jgi:hypothetical protein
MAGAVWLSELSAVLRGQKRLAMAPTVSNDEDQQQQMGRSTVHGTKATSAAGKPGVDRKETVAEGGGGMSDATVYMLFDRFAPTGPCLLLLYIHDTCTKQRK